MSSEVVNTWRKGEFYEILCICVIGVSIWTLGVQLSLFKYANDFIAHYRLSNFALLIVFMSVALVFGAMRKSLHLRREMVARARAETEARVLARHDSLTGLPNRRLLIEAIDKAARHSGGTYAVLLVDLDRFKPVNDIHGHSAGDAVLCHTADRLKAALPAGAMAARLGGDEFAVFTGCDAGTADVVRLAQRINLALCQPIPWYETQLEVGATTGIALMPDDGVSAETLLHAADVAMYRGKREGRGTYRFFEQNMDTELKARAALEGELRAAIHAGHIHPYFQPLVSLTDHSLLGFEVLARWEHPTKGVLMPDMFIPIAEETGLIAELSYRLLREACQQASEWPAHLTLAINISPSQLRDRWLAEHLLAILTDVGFPPGRLEVEITETALVNDIETARSTLRSLQNVGVRISLDDFGTGYSSLYHLRELHFDKIKIDRSFVQSREDNHESTKIVSAIIGLGKSLGLLTTAEGIENSENLGWLAEQGCSFGQGFFFGKPMSASDVAQQYSFDPSADGASMIAAAMPDDALPGDALPAAHAKKRTA
jgi:diguanylate cyclase (GGDEF)-like protein